MYTTVQRTTKQAGEIRVSYVVRVVGSAKQTVFTTYKHENVFRFGFDQARIKCITPISSCTLDNPTLQKYIVSEKNTTPNAHLLKSLNN